MVVLRLPDSWSNWNLEMLGEGKREREEERVLGEGKTGAPGEKPRRRDLNPGYTGGRPIGASSLLPKKITVKCKLDQLSVPFSFYCRHKRRSFDTLIHHFYKNLLGLALKNLGS